MLAQSIPAEAVRVYGRYEVTMMHAGMDRNWSDRHIALRSINLKSSRERMEQLGCSWFSRLGVHQHCDSDES